MVSGKSFSPQVGSSETLLREKLAALPDPELPMITIGELGILREVVCEPGRARVVVTPTYSGCPALEAIRSDIVKTAQSLGWRVQVETSYAPAWTTDWLSEETKLKLHQHGIAPPPGRADQLPPPPVDCPRCGVTGAETISRFGSTACKALMVCRACREPFDLFKAH